MRCDNMNKLLRFFIKLLLDLLAIICGGAIAFVLYLLWLHFVGYQWGDIMMKPLITVLQDRMKYDYENNILKAVQSIGIDVDKERLAKALIDSRGFYDEGYADAKAKYENALDKAIKK